MPDVDTAWTVQAVESIGSVPSDAWDRCAGSGNPFLSHAFLAALEESGSVAPEEGWSPCHLVARNADGKVAGCAPFYLKGHSQGEYVFDHGWADAFERAGGRYYPKLLSAVPFTPVTGPRLLVRPGEDVRRIRTQLVGGMYRLAERFGVSSFHINFPTEAEWRDLGSLGLLLREGQQFHWTNPGYKSFDSFLAALSSRKRKNIRKERRAVTDAGVTLHRLTGAKLRPEHWHAFYGFYRHTTDRKWGWDYLKREHFDILHARMADRVLLVMAELNGKWVAGALNFVGSDALYGRNWGGIVGLRHLHFEVCYYQAIEHAIETGLARVEAGAQGPHKIQRGYLPVRTYSAHWFAHDGLRRAVERFLDHERRAVDEDMAVLEGHSPFRKS